MRHFRPFRGLLAVCSWLLLLAVAVPARAAWHSLEEIPVESPVYRLLDDVASNYPLSSGLLLTRPWTRGDLGRFLDQLVVDVPAAAEDPAVLRLRRELAPGGGAEGLEPALAAEQDDASLELSPYARFSYAEDKARATVVRDERLGLQASMAFGAHTLLFADGYAGNLTPGPHGTPDESGQFTQSSTDVTAWIDRAYLTWSNDKLMLRAGHTWLQWGPGANGSMALSDGAPAFDVLEARVRFLGSGQLTWFVAALDPAGEAYLAGHRLEFRAGPSVQLSFSELARFNGTGNAALYLLPVIPYALIDRRVHGSSSLQPTAHNNVMYATDFSWTWRPGIRVYGEVAVDDATRDNSRPLEMAWQLGGQLRRLVNGAAWSLRGEYSRVYQYTYSIANGQNFSNVGFPTAFPLGPDVDRWTGRFEWRPDGQWVWGLETSDVRKGAGLLGQPWSPGLPVPTRLVLTSPAEQDQRFAATADWSPSPSVTLGAVGGSAKVHTRDHVYGSTGNGGYFTAHATFRW